MHDLSQSCGATWGRLWLNLRIPAIFKAESQRTEQSGDWNAAQEMVAHSILWLLVKPDVQGCFLGIWLWLSIPTFAVVKYQSAYWTPMAVGCCVVINQCPSCFFTTSAEAFWRRDVILCLFVSKMGSMLKNLFKVDVWMDSIWVIISWAVWDLPLGKDTGSALELKPEECFCLFSACSTFPTSIGLGAEICWANITRSKPVLRKSTKKERTSPLSYSLFQRLIDHTAKVWVQFPVCHLVLSIHQ